MRNGRQVDWRSTIWVATVSWIASISASIVRQVPETSRYLTGTPRPLPSTGSEFTARAIPCDVFVVMRGFGAARGSVGAQAKIITRPLWRSRSADSARQRDAWINIDDSAVGRASSIVPGAMADGKDYRWVVSYQRGEIIALIQRVTELELRLQRRSRALTGALALVAFGVVGSLGYWIWVSLPAPSEAVLPLATATSDGREPLRLPRHSNRRERRGRAPLAPMSPPWPRSRPACGLRPTSERRHPISPSRARPQPHQFSPTNTWSDPCP